MPWRISYWRATALIREVMIEEGNKAGIAAMLERLTIQQMDLDVSEPSEQAAGAEQDVFNVRTNRSGSMLWTTGRVFHYTAEWYSRGTRKRQPLPPR